MADLAGEHFDFALVTPFARRREMLGGVRGSFTRLDFADDRVDPIAHDFVPIFFFRGRLAADDKRPISATAVAHVRGTAVRAVNQITELNHPAGGMRATIKSHRASAPAAWNSRFQADFI